MFRALPRLLFATLLGLGLANIPAVAATPTPGVLRMDDTAGLFSAAGIRAGKDRMAEVTFKGPTHYGVATFREIPESKRTQFDAVKNDANRRRGFFADWARELAKAKDNHGDVFTLVFWNGKAFQVVTVSDQESDIHRGFNDSRADAVSKEFIKVLTIANDAKQTPNKVHPEMDTALLAAIEHIIGDLKDTAAPDAKQRGDATSTKNIAGAGSGIMSYVCLGICILAGVWLVIGLIRMFTGGGGGGYGGGGYGGGGYGGGGGGFLTSMLGGMFGAAAGMYMYNNFFGGHSESATAGESYGDSGATDTGDGDYAGGAEGGDGGGDWGDENRNDTSGGDWGDSGAGGGGDWGGDGGGDFGGGGDW